MKDAKIQPGTKPAPEKYHITVLNDGPYLIYGQPPLAQLFIMNNDEGNSWTFAEGLKYTLSQDPVALCRCGESKDKPYCDGSHLKADWDPRLTASETPLLDGAERFKGPGVSLTDNSSYCVFARFCDGKGRVWNLVGESDDPQKREHTVYEANMCPAGRLSAWDNDAQEPFEPYYDPSLVLIEDKPMAISAGLWVRGGIAIQREDGFTYEIRNRAVLCRCGQSANKPWCDGTHASLRFKDGLPTVPVKK